MFGTFYLHTKKLLEKFKNQFSKVATKYNLKKVVH